MNLGAANSLMDIAGWINAYGNECRNHSRLTTARVAYRIACLAAPSWHAPWFNRGLIAKSERRWDRCRDLNRKSADLDPNDPPSWWNLGIAATALGDWATARTAWSKYGIDVPDGFGPLDMNLGAVPIRVAPDKHPEVVWCDRLDPARAVIRNIPTANSGRGYGDLVLHDGEPKGTRTNEGREVPVFDELQVLSPGRLHTFTAAIAAADPVDVEALDAATHGSELAMEDWTSSIRYLCKSCSEGSPHEHCAGPEDEGWNEDRVVAIAAPSEESVRALLARWAAEGPGRRAGEIECVFRRPDR